jgi:hypothetical protein
MIRFVAVVCGLFVSGIVGFSLALLVITTPLQWLLGPRQAEFDFFGLLGVPVVAALVGAVGAAWGGSGSEAQFRATFAPTNLLRLVLLAPLVLLILARLVSGDFAWWACIHLAGVAGILTAVALARWLRGPQVRKD